MRRQLAELDELVKAGDGRARRRKNITAKAEVVLSLIHISQPISGWRRRDGALHVITGRHRFDLAARDGVEFIPAYVCLLYTSRCV